MFLTVEEVLVLLVLLCAVSAITGCIVYYKYQNPENQNKSILQLLLQTLKEVTMSIICAPVLVVGTILLMFWAAMLPLLYNFCPESTFVQRQYTIYVSGVNQEHRECTAPSTPQSV